jgi:hypothetical protein
VALSHVSLLSHVLPCFPILIQSSLHLVIFKHPYLTHTKSDSRNLKCCEFSTSFSSHLRFRFPLEGKNLAFEKILWSNRFLKVPLVEIIFYENQGDICFLWDLGLWILTMQPSHSYTLAYRRPIHLLSIEFQNIDNDQGNPPKKLFFPFNCYNLAIHEVTLTEISSTNY